MQGALATPTRLLSFHVWELLAVLGTVLLGAGVALAANYVFAAIGGIVLIFLLSRGPLTRAVVVVAGGLTLLQLSPGLSIEKFAYLAVLILATLFASLHIASRWSVAKNFGARPILLSTAGVAAIVALSVLIALNNGITIQAWALDIPAYGMLVVAVILGLDLALSSHQPRDIALTVMLAGLITAVGYAIFWTRLRGLTEFDVSRFVLPTQFLPAAAFCLLLAYVFDGRRTNRMALLATLLVLAMLVSGTRILILFVVPVIVTVAVASGHRRLRIVSLFIVAGITLALLAGIVGNTPAAGYVNLEVLQARLAGIVPLLTSPDITTDPSIYLRYLQTHALQQAWSQNPLFGVGPGALYSYFNVVGERPVDSPLAILARFGVIGVAVIVVLFATLFASRLRRGAHWVPATALVAFISLIAAWSLVSSPLDDKGVALGLIPLIGLCGVWRKEPQPLAKMDLNELAGLPDVGRATQSLRPAKSDGDSR
jgi:hypothetical protein